MADQLINNLVGMCAYQGRSQDVPCGQTVRAKAEYCTACAAADRLKSALKLAREATNGWGCYAKRGIEHDEIARLHHAITEAGG
jgi:hypothetical protein